MTIYYYELERGCGDFEAKDDEEALLKMPTGSICLYKEGETKEDGMIMLYEKGE